MKASARAALSLLLGASTAGASCDQQTLDFILLEGDALMAQIEDDIAKDLRNINVTVNTRLLAKADFNTAMQTGDFHLCFTETWGPPYDPHSFATGWFREGNEAHYKALDGMDTSRGVDKAKLQQMVTDVLKTENEAERQTEWTAILQEMHSQAISIPMWSSRMPAVVNRRLQGYAHGAQQFDYPMHPIQVQSGSSSVTVSPGAQTGLFVSTGPMDPHSYRPNEFFISNWIYEGLVSYGAGGVITPQLATAWTSTDTQDGGQEWRFTLRSGVTFHDGEPFNCAAVKLTFDHVLQPPLNTVDYHGWYHLPLNLRSWSCDGEVFVAVMAEPYYPFLQELSLIRPLRILSPKCYTDGTGADPVSHNSCPTKWSPTGLTCTGVQCTAGTGPWKFVESTTNGGGEVEMAKFAKNTGWWNVGTFGGVEELIVKHYPDSAAVEAALLSEELDMVVGGKVLTPEQVQDLDANHATKFAVTQGPPLLNHIMVVNAAKAPTDDLTLRQALAQAIDKAAIVGKELPGSAEVADTVFPDNAPYCDVDLTPARPYDIEAARDLLSCAPTPAPPTAAPTSAPTSASGGPASDEVSGTKLGAELSVALFSGIACLLGA